MAIILKDNDFNSIVKALKRGRAVNITAVVLTFVSAVQDGDQFAVLIAVQLLWVNLIMDTLAALAQTGRPH